MDYKQQKEYTGREIKLDPNSRYKNSEKIIYNSLDVYSKFPKAYSISIRDPLAKHIFDSGDDLELISYKYYGTTKFWWVIAKANNIVDPFIPIAVGTTFYIPRRRYIPEYILG